MTIDLKEQEARREKWFSESGWKGNPFTLCINSMIFVGYEAQIKAAMRHISERHKIALITGPTGAGKTSMMRWIEANNSIKTLYITKPPAKPEEFVQIFLDCFPLNFLEKILGRKPNLYNLDAFVNGRLKGKQILILLDESHETNKEVLEWLRVLVDQIENVSLILAGLPVLEDKIRQALETFDQRITSRIKLSALEEAETMELIKMRIEGEGGSGIKPFTDEAVREIFRKTGGFPREILKLCDKLVNDAIEKEMKVIDGNDIGDYRDIKEEPVSSVQQPVQTLSDLPFKQKKLIEALSQKTWLTPSDIAEQMEGNYRSKEHAIRSINNILKRLMGDGLVQRESRGKAFVYTLTPKTKTLMVES
jgi:type II secretory pathway predicted ATPase ExeA